MSVHMHAVPEEGESYSPEIEVTDIVVSYHMGAGYWSSARLASALDH